MDFEVMRRTLNTGTTTLNYTDGFHLALKAAADGGRHAVTGMPRRAVYEADVGWEDLMAVYVPTPPARQGATAVPAAANAKRPPVSPGERQRDQSKDQR